jgi:hypothetical protein
MMALGRRAIAVAIGTALLAAGTSTLCGVLSQGCFASRVAGLSEPAGYFDTDNLISNERSYLQILPDLQRADIRSGAYIGVGPDQNFSYIADIRPTIAFIVDIRRDNLLLHLLFKALFEQSRTRVEYLALLFGRPGPSELEAWRGATIDRLASYIDDASVDGRSIPALRSRVDAAIRNFGVPLSADDMGTIDRFHRRFIEAGLGLKFESTGRPPQPYYPTYGELLRETDPLGRQGSFLASEAAFQFVKSLEQRDLVIPVVGDLSGPKALVEIARLLQNRGERLSAFYTSNVESYLQRAGTFGRFADNLSRIPHTSRSVVIRSIFGRFNGGSTSVVQPVDELLASWH